MEAHERINRSKKEIFVNNFIGGIAWGLGATVGLAIVLTIIGFLISKAGLVPIVGDFVANVNEYILQNHPQLIK
ncbi:MAG: hypothetical protein HY427_01185 [Candidatus Levybacteria bacterium]|nr:hypothetical protein [Candidatus Levybacteria bacterium]